MDYVFYKTADAAQDDIWRYTLETWNEEQAIRYITGLHAHIQALAKKTKIWRALPESLFVPSDLDVKVYFSRYKHHYIFFRVLPSQKLGIMSILHEAQDIPVRLAGDLQKIEAIENIETDE